MGFKQSPSDPCVYMNSGGARSLIIGVYVDDIVVCGNNIIYIQGKLSQRFKLKDLGELINTSWE